MKAERESIDEGAENPEGSLFDTLPADVPSLDAVDPPTHPQSEHPRDPFDHGLADLDGGIFEAAPHEALVADGAGA